MQDYVTYMFFRSQFGAAYHFVEESVFQQFAHNVEANYKDLRLRWLKAWKVHEFQGKDPREDR